MPRPVTRVGGLVSVIHFPVKLENVRNLGARSVICRTSPAKVRAPAASSRSETRARVQTPTRDPRALNFCPTRRRLPSRPETTHDEGRIHGGERHAFVHQRLKFNRTTASRRASLRAASVDQSSSRRHQSNASSSENTPARHAADDSPMLCRSCHGRTPHFIHICASAYSRTNKAGCDSHVSSSERGRRQQSVSPLWVNHGRVGLIEMRAKYLGAGVNLISEERLGFVNLTRHPYILCALSRKHKTTGRVARS